MHGQDQGVTDHASILERGQHRIYCARLSNELCGALGNNSLSFVSVRNMVQLAKSATDEYDTGL